MQRRTNPDENSIDEQNPTMDLGAFLSLAHPVHICPYCHKNFPSSYALGGHQNAHRKERMEEKKRYAMDPTSYRKRAFLRSVKSFRVMLPCGGSRVSPSVDDGDGDGDGGLGKGASMVRPMPYHLHPNHFHPNLLTTSELVPPAVGGITPNHFHPNLFPTSELVPPAVGGITPNHFHPNLFPTSELVAAALGGSTSTSNNFHPNHFHPNLFPTSELVAPAVGGSNPNHFHRNLLPKSELVAANHFNPNLLPKSELVASPLRGISHVETYYKATVPAATIGAFSGSKDDKGINSPSLDLTLKL